MFQNKRRPHQFFNSSLEIRLVATKYVYIPVVLRWAFDDYRIYSINSPGRLFNSGTMRVGAYYFLQHFQQARTFLESNKTRDNTFFSLQ